MAAEEPPASAELPAAQFNLFPTVEEQIENIAQVQAEEQQESLPFPASQVSEAVIGRALTGGGDDDHSIERIVAFFQKQPTGSLAASFMEKEFGEGGRGVKIAGQDYSLWFDHEGFRIAPGRSAFGPGSTLASWVNVATMTIRLLGDGMFASQDRIDAAPDNEFRELAEKLWNICHDFSDAAKEQEFLPSVKFAYSSFPGFPEGSAKIAELLKDPVKRQDVIAELVTFINAYQKDSSLLRFRPSTPLSPLFQQISELEIEPTPFQAVEGFTPAKANFITEDEITQLLQRGSNISESKLRIYAYFMQGHDAKECAVFLRNEYGEGGTVHGEYRENHGSKGIQFIRSDEESGYKGYDTVQLNWNQVQKRVRALIDSGRYLNEQEKAYLPTYETQTFARKIYFFYLNDPNRTNPPGADMDAAMKKIRAVLEADDPEKESGLFHEMFNIMAAVSPDDPAYQKMIPVLRDMEAFTRDEYSLYAPLPENVLQAERQAKQAAKEAKRKSPTAQSATTEAPPASGDRLAAAARALAKKRPKAVQEDQDGQFDLFSAAASVPLESEPPAPIPEVQPAAPSQAPEQDAPDEAAARYELGYAHMGNGLTVWNSFEQEDGDYKIVAHIAPDRTVTFYDKDMPEAVKARIMDKYLGQLTDII